jgi:FtsP/CotA-like multicopper oxidase with cupredoxin domain
MTEIQAFGTRRNTFFTGNNNNLLKHVCPPTFGGGPLDRVQPDRTFELQALASFDLPLPPAVAEMVGATTLPMWIIRNRNANPERDFPSPLLRMVQGQVIHADVSSSGNTHTIHWHGIEPTTMNDGVGKHSFELGQFVYQFQANEAGTFFYHCHKNTTLHFEMGMYGGLIVDPLAPEGSGLVAPYVTGGPGFVAGRLTTSPAGTRILPYDIEKIWVVDDMDSRWHLSGMEAEPEHNHNMQACNPADPADPGTFYVFGTATTMGEFELNDFRQDIFTVSGVVMDVGEGPPFVGVIDNAAIRIDANAGQTVLLRYINASYSIQELTLPVPATVIAWDGHPLGIGGFHDFAPPYVVPAGTPIRTTSARRMDLIVQGGVGQAEIRTYDWVRGVPDGLVGITRIPVSIG